jgi:hypothetical protein
MGSLVKDYMLSTFALLPGSLSPADARASLPADTYGVILDAQGEACGLVTADDLAAVAQRDAPTLLHPAAGLHPVVVIGGAWDMHTLVESDVMPLFDLGARGAIVLDDAGIVGVLPVAVVDTYLGSGAYELPTTTMGPSAKGGDASLAGAFQTPRGKLVCAVCGYSNTVAFFDEEYPPLCQNTEVPEHRLTRGGT